jgi:hypothetical protein
MNDTLWGDTAGTNSERGNGRILEVQEVGSPKVGGLVLGPGRAGSGLVAELFVHSRAC